MTLKDPASAVADTAGVGRFDWERETTHRTGAGSVEDP